MSFYRGLSTIWFPASLLVATIAVLASVYVMQYGFGYAPCEMCLWQRYPYFAIIALGIGATAIHKRKLACTLLLLLMTVGYLISTGLATYHYGVEEGIFEGMTECTSSESDTSSIEAMRAAIMDAPIVRCDDPTAVFFGLSLAGWNVLASIGFVIASLIILKLYRTQHNRRRTYFKTRAF